MWGWIPAPFGLLLRSSACSLKCSSVPPLQDVAGYFFHSCDGFVRRRNVATLPRVGTVLCCFQDVGLPFEAAGLLGSVQLLIEDISHAKDSCTRAIEWEQSNQRTQVLRADLGEHVICSADANSVRDDVGELHESGNGRVSVRRPQLPLSMPCRALGYGHTP